MPESICGAILIRRFVDVYDFNGAYISASSYSFQMSSEQTGDVKCVAVFDSLPQLIGKKAMFYVKDSVVEGQLANIDNSWTFFGEAVIEESYKAELMMLSGDPKLNYFKFSTFTIGAYAPTGELVFSGRVEPTDV